MVGFTRQDQIDLNAAPRGQRQSGEQGRVGDEIGRHRQDPPLRGKTARNKQRENGVVGPIRAAGDQLRLRLDAGRRRLEKPRLGRRRALTGQRPVLLELLLRLAGDTAVEIEGEVYPGTAAQNRARIALEVLGRQIATAAP